MPRSLLIGKGRGLVALFGSAGRKLRARRAAATRKLRSAIELLENRLFLSANWFVSTTGSDDSRGTLDQPFRTIQQAANLAQPGDSVFVRGGTYRETVKPTTSGTASAPIIFKAYNNEQVTVSGADVVSGFSQYDSNIYQAK